MISSNHLNAILATVHKRANNHFVHLAGSVGKVAPSPKAAAYLDHSHRATAPLGLIESTGATNSELDQNEYEPLSLTHSLHALGFGNVLILKRICDRRYIVYDTAQVVQGFLLKIRLA